MTEKQITEEILRYLKDESYNYAVLIDGEWGSGKTFFVNNILTKEINKQEANLNTNRSVKYVSLYGCKDMADVQENIAWSFAEDARRKIKNRMKWGTTVEKVSSNILLSSQKIGNVIMKKFLPEASLYKISSDWLNLGSFIFIFDDLERCDCPVNEVFGFLNELVEHENTKVIIIANEKELMTIADTQSLELQYYLALDERVQWPKTDEDNVWSVICKKPEGVSLTELEKRRSLLFPVEESGDYCRIREKLIGVTLKYDPNIPEIISQIIETSNCESSVKGMLRGKKESFEDTMEYYHHRNLRTFQFFLSKVTYLLGQLENIKIDQEYYEAISNQVISETFMQAVRFKSNYQPPKDNYTWLSIEQDTNFHSVKQYVESGTYDYKNYENEVLKYQNELKADVFSDDPYYLLYRQYYYQTQVWCEEQLDKMIKQLRTNKYPISLYGRIIMAIQRLIDLGFDEQYMNEAKKWMLENISNSGEVEEIDPDLWFVEDREFRDRVIAIVADINEAIKNHTETASRENVIDILKNDDWIAKLKKYVNPNDLRYVQDISVFSKAPSAQWLKNMHKASPKDIDDFRELLEYIYPRGVRRNSYIQDADTIKAIIEGLRKIKEDDLIKKACIRWLGAQFEAIVKLHEPQIEQKTE